MSFTKKIFREERTAKAMVIGLVGVQGEISPRDEKVLWCEHGTHSQVLAQKLETLGGRWWWVVVKER